MIWQAHHDRLRRAATMVGLALTLTAIGAREAQAHCDTMDGPVVAAARRALEQGAVHHALLWVQPAQEDEVRHAYAITSKVWREGGDARRVAEHHFLETVVRLHREGEGEPYTGLKPAGQIDPAVAAADRALAAGSAAELERVLLHAVRDGLRERFERALAAKRFAPEDVTAGRAYVAAYVPLVHFVEQVHALAAGTAHAPSTAPSTAPGHRDH